MYVCRFAHGSDTFSLGTTSLLVGSSGLLEAYTKACPSWTKKIYRNMLVPCHETMPSFMIFRRVLDLQELNNQVFQSFRQSHDATCLNFIPVSFMGPINSPKDTHVISQPTLVH